MDNLSEGPPTAPPRRSQEGLESPLLPPGDRKRGGHLTRPGPIGFSVWEFGVRAERYDLGMSDYCQEATTGLLSDKGEILVCTQS